MRRSLLVHFLAVLLLAGTTTTAHATSTSSDARAALTRRPTWPAEAVSGSLLVTRGERGGPVVHRVRVQPGTEVAEAQRLRAQPGVHAVEPDERRPALRVPDDVRFAEQWAHRLTHADAAWERTTGDPTVEVAIVDSGVEGGHPDLRANLVAQVDVSSGEMVDRGLGVDNDACDVGHGTFVAGVVGAVGGNGVAVAGVAWRVGIVDVAASDQVRCGLFSDSAVLAALRYAVVRGVDVVNLSFGGAAGTCPTSFQTAIDAARAAGVVVVAAAGNEQQTQPGSTSVPASCNGVISVGAVGENGEVARYSNANDYIDLVAPGGDRTTGTAILSLAGTASTGYGVVSDEGTSFSAPYVSGAAALLRVVRPSLTADEVESVLERTAFGATSGRTPARGWGLVDLDAALGMAAAPSAVAPPVPDPRFPVGLVMRLSANTATTEAVTQATAVSRSLFPDGRALHAVLARRDDFADALAGSSLAFGVGPLLFAAPSGPLAPETAGELQRALPRGATVYLLGGTSALPRTLEDELRALGLEPRRLAGTNREHTAALVAGEMQVRLPQVGFDVPPVAILATARQWPDAVTAGSLGAWYGIPILLSDPTELSSATRSALAELRPGLLYVAGGTAALSDAVVDAAKSAAGSGEVARLAGRDRHETAAAVAGEFRALMRAQSGTDPLLVAGVNLRRADGFAHVLSASAYLGAYSGVFLGLDGEGGESVPAASAQLACQLVPLRGLVVGNRDLVAEPTMVRLNRLLEHTSC